MRENTHPFVSRQPIPDLFSLSGQTTDWIPQIQWNEVHRLARIMQGHHQRPEQLILRPMQSSIPDRLALAGSFLVAG